jgi:hypothetical protein
MDFVAASWPQRSGSIIARRHFCRYLVWSAVKGSRDGNISLVSSEADEYPKGRSCILRTHTTVMRNVSHDVAPSSPTYIEESNLSRVTDLLFHRGHFYGSHCVFAIVFVLLHAWLSACSLQVPNLGNSGAASSHSGSLSPAVTPSVIDDGTLPPDIQICCVTLQLRLPEEEKIALNQLLLAQTTGGSPSYHKWLTPLQFQARFSPDAGNIAVITAWLGSQEFSVVESAGGGRFLTVSGSAGQMNRAFSVSLYQVLWGGSRYFGPRSPPTTAAEIAPLIEGVRGLTDLTPATSATSSIQGATDDVPGATAFAAKYGIADLQKKRLTGSGIRLALLSSPAREARDGLCVSAIAPEAVILDENSSSKSATSGRPSERDWISRVSAIVDAGEAQIIGLAVPGCEADYSPEERLAAEAIFQQATAEGITVIARSGSCDQGAAFPGSLPEVTAVGSISTEVSAFTGVSNSVKKPSWQFVSGVPADGMRDEPDASFESPANTEDLAVAAFSAATALLLEGVSLRDPSETSSQGSLNPALYQLASVEGTFTKINGSEAGTYTIGEGLGTPNFANLLKVWPRIGTTASTIQLTASSYNATVNTSITLTAMVTSSSATGTVTFADVTAGTLGSGTLSGGVATLTISTLTAGPHTISAVYSGDDTYAASTSSSIGIYVTSDSTPVTGTLTTSLSSYTISYGSTTTLKAVVTLASGTATGSVKATVDGTIYTGTLSSGIATIAVASPTPGTYSVVVACVTNMSYTCSSTVTLSLTVTGASSTTTITPSVTTALSRQQVTLTAVIASTASALGTPTGTVAFYDDSSTIVNQLGTATVSANGASGGTVSLITTGLGPGTHAIYAIYSGSTNFLTSTSSSTTITIEDFLVSFFPSSLSVTKGSDGISTGTISAVSGFTGTVTLSCTAPASSNTTCSLSNTSIDTSGTTVLTVATTTSTSALRRPYALWIFSGTTLAALLLIPPLTWGSMRLSFPVGLLAIALMGMTSCGAGGGASDSSSSSGTPLGTLIFTVTASGTDGYTTVRHASTVQITVQ